MDAPRRAAPQLALRADVGEPEALMQQVGEGILDIAIVYAPRSANDVFVDWGPEFVARHNLAFPDLAGAGVFAGLGPLGRAHLLAVGGSGYFRLSAVREHLESGHPHRVPGAPEFLHPAGAVPSDLQKAPTSRW